MSTMPILFNDILHLTDAQLANTKIRFNIRPGGTPYDPIRIFQDDPQTINEEWLFARKGKNDFSVGQNAISLVRLSEKQDLWLFTTMKTVTEDTGVHGGTGWMGKEWECYKPLYGRLIVQYHKKQRRQIVWANGSCGIAAMEVREILPDIYRDNPFPGYDCFASMSFQQAHQYFSAVWADGFPRSRHHAVSDVR